MTYTRLGMYDPRRTTIAFCGNYVLVNDQPRYPKSHEGRRAPKFEYSGLTFESRAEIQLVKLIVQQGICFRHHVRFPFSKRIGRATVWSPDFLFDQPFLWPDVESPVAHHWLIHGIEVKACPIDDDLHQKQRQLVEDHNVHILLLHRREIKKCARNGALPLIPYVPRENERVLSPVIDDLQSNVLAAVR